MMVRPQTAQLSINFFLKENQWCCTSTRDWIKATLLRDRKRRKKPAGIEPTTTKSIALQACALLPVNQESRTESFLAVAWGPALTAWYPRRRNRRGWVIKNKEQSMLTRLLPFEKEI